MSLFFEYMQVLCTFCIKMLFFEYMHALCTLVKIMHCLLLMPVLEKYKSQNLRRVCNFEVNKAQLKTESVFDFDVLCILSY